MATLHNALTLDEACDAMNLPRLPAIADVSSFSIEAGAVDVAEIWIDGARRSVTYVRADGDWVDSDSWDGLMMVLTKGKR